MEAETPLTTTLGEVALPADYLVWRTVRPTFATLPGHADIPPTIRRNRLCASGLSAAGGQGLCRLFTIEGNTFKVRPVDDRAGAYEFHYYQKIPTLVGTDLNTNWLITAYPDVYVEGCWSNLRALGRNAEFAQLHKARRDELFAEIIQLSALTTGATSPTVRTAEYF